MNRIFSTQNLIELTIGLILAVMVATVSMAQEPGPTPPPGPPEPQPALEINAPDRATADTLVRVKIAGVELKPTDSMVWDVVCGAKFLANDQVEQMPNGLIFTGAESAEPYRVRLAFIRDGIVQRLESKVMIGKAPIPPPPGPDPPGPGPAPGTITKLRVIYVEETKDATQSRAKWLGDAGLLKYFDDEDKSYVAVDKDVRNQAGQIPREIAPALERVKAKGITLPAYVIENHETNEIVADGTLKGSTPAQHLLILKGVCP